MSEVKLESFEAGRRGKPDELESTIANQIGAAFLQRNRNARYDVRVSGSYDSEQDTRLVTISGEVSKSLLTKEITREITDIVIDHYNQVHRTRLDYDKFSVNVRLKPQSDSLALNTSSGDSGNPIAVAYRFGPNFLPWERFLAVEIRDALDTIFQSDGRVPEELTRLSGVEELKGLRADGKIGVGILYEGCKPVAVDHVVICAEHERTLAVGELRDKVNRIAQGIIKKNLPSLNPATIAINGLGDWNEGGWAADEGSREAKPYRDGFATYGVNEDAFSGEDPSKPSASGTLLARYIAVQIVAREVADFARVALNYRIGDERVGLNIFTNNTAIVPQAKIEAWVRKNIPLRICDSERLFDLRDPELYRSLAASADYFQQRGRAWNQINAKLWDPIKKEYTGPIKY